MDDRGSDGFAELDHRVMGHCFACQNELGKLADEMIYQRDIADRLQNAGMSVEAEVPIDVDHKSFSKRLFVDLIINGLGVYELKTVERLTARHESQLLCYLYLLDLAHGKLVNFRSDSVEWRFVNAPIAREDRRCFELDVREFDGNQRLVAIVADLVRDWGTCLSGSLYREAIIHLLGGEAAVVRRLPLKRGANMLGHQSFQMCGEDDAFQLTTFTDCSSSYPNHLRRLLRFSPLKRFHWINIAPRQVTLRTIQA